MVYTWNEMESLTEGEFVIDTFKSVWETFDPVVVPH